MIAAWMAWAAAAALLLAVAARLGEAALRVVGRPTRFAWIAALLLGALLPPAAWLQARRAAERPAAAPAVATTESDATTEAGALDALLARARVTVAAPPALARLDRPLVALWALLSAAALLRLALAGRRLRRAREEWRHETVDGVAVLVAGRTGPAVAGVLTPAVVLPEWALASDPALVRLMLAHEREHVRAGDPRLLAAGAVVAALVPWNPGIWLSLHRLRLAVEADCDRRVLRRHPDVRRYGGLLLEVGRRLPAAEPLPVAALASSSSHLERRIRLMTMSRPRHPLVAGLGLASAAGLLLLAACEMPRPTEVTPAGEMPLASIRSGGHYAPTGEVTPAVVREALEATMQSEELTAHRGTPVNLYFVVDPQGRVLHSEFSRQRMPAGEYSVTPSRSDATDAEREQVRVRMQSAGGEGVGRTEMRASTIPGAVASIDPEAIQSIDVLKSNAGVIVADQANVIWVTLKEGATFESAQLSEEAARAQRTRVESSQVMAHARAQARTGVAGGGPRVSIVEPDSAHMLGAKDAPLYIVDGVIIEQDRGRMLRELDPNTIESIEVIKGSAAIAKYGDAGRNGVIMITLKKPAPR